MADQDRRLRLGRPAQTRNHGRGQRAPDGDHTLEDFGTGYKSFGLGTEFDELEAFLEDEAKNSRRIQALWAEFPANPLLVTPDLARLRDLADKYDFPLLIDDTVASFCNVDVLGADGADVLITSLTKSFSGYADVMAGSAVINPITKQKPIF